MKIKSFDPIINSNSKVLILGSMPGNESLRQQQYYAHPQNRFWNIMYMIFEKDVDSEYADKVKFLQERGIALWDVFKNCEREGSLDANIRNEELNNIATLLEEHPRIKFVFCNGGKAYEQYKKKILPSLKRIIPYVKLPSTSPANASISMDKKLHEWSKIRLAIEKETT